MALSSRAVSAPSDGHLVADDQGRGSVVPGRGHRDLEPRRVRASTVGEVRGHLAQVDGGGVGGRRPFGSQEQVVDDGNHALGVAYDARTVSDSRRCGVAAPEVASEQLCPGAEQRQRRAQLMAGVRDEVPLQGQCLGQRLDCPPPHDGADHGGQHEAKDARRQQRCDQVLPLAVLRRQVQCRLYDSGSTDGGPDPELAVAHLQVANDRRPRGGDPVQVGRQGQWGRSPRRRQRPTGLADREPGARRRIAHVVGTGSCLP